MTGTKHGNPNGFRPSPQSADHRMGTRPYFGDTTAEPSDPSQTVNAPRHPDSPANRGPGPADRIAIR